MFLSWSEGRVSHQLQLSWKAIESRQPSGEDRRQPPLARATERIVVRQTLVELRERTVLALQQNPFDVDELRVPPHANAHLSLEIELVLRCHRQALERIECALVKLPHHRNDEKSAPSARRSNPEGKLEAIGSYCFERPAKPLPEAAPVIPGQ